MKKCDEFYFEPLSLTCLYGNYLEWALVKERRRGEKEGKPEFRVYRGGYEC